MKSLYLLVLSALTLNTPTHASYTDAQRGIDLASPAHARAIKVHNPQASIQHMLDANNEFTTRLSDHVASTAHIDLGGESVDLFIWNIWCPGTQGGFDKFQNAQ